MISTAGFLPATRFAVDAYVHFVRDRSLEAVASSLTEMFSTQIIAERVEACSQLRFHQPRHPGLLHATSDPGPDRCAFALGYVKEHAERRISRCSSRYAALQMRRAVGAARCPAFRLCRTPSRAARRFRPVNARDDGGARRSRERRHPICAAVRFRFDERRKAGSCSHPSGCCCPTNTRLRSCA